MIFRREPPSEPGLYWCIQQYMGPMPVEVLKIESDSVLAFSIGDDGYSEFTNCLWGDRIEIPTVEEAT